MRIFVGNVWHYLWLRPWRTVASLILCLVVMIGGGLLIIDNGDRGSAVLVIRHEGLREAITGVFAEMGHQPWKRLDSNVAKRTLLDHGAIVLTNPSETLYQELGRHSGVYEFCKSDPEGDARRTRDRLALWDARLVPENDEIFGTTPIWLVTVPVPDTDQHIVLAFRRNGVLMGFKGLRKYIRDYESPEH